MHTTAAAKVDFRREYRVSSISHVATCNLDVGAAAEWNNMETSCP